VRLVIVGLQHQDVERFLVAGFCEDRLEAFAVVAASTITNYTGSITKPPFDAPFRAHACAARNSRRRRAHLVGAFSVKSASDQKRTMSIERTEYKFRLLH
jgi:hypothetical protein